MCVERKKLTTGKFSVVFRGKTLECSLFRQIPSFVEVTENHVNHVAGYGLADPCIEGIHQIVQQWTTLALAILYMQMGATVGAHIVCMYLT